MDNKIKLKSEVKVIRNDDKFLEIQEINFNIDNINKFIQTYLIQKQTLLERFIYQQLETELLEKMKRHIEFELERREAEE